MESPAFQASEWHLIRVLLRYLEIRVRALPVETIGDAADASKIVDQLQSMRGKIPTSFYSIPINYDFPEVLKRAIPDIGG